jgi:hypothetical protein
MVGGLYQAKDIGMSRKSKQLIHEGKYAAEIEVDLIPDDGAWGPYVGAPDVRKLDRVRLALRRGDIAAASREARVFELLPISA